MLKSHSQGSTVCLWNMLETQKQVFPAQRATGKLVTLAPATRGLRSTTWPKALALMGVGTTSQKQTASGLSSEGQTLQADPREMGKKESACLLPDSRLFLWETRRLPSSRSPGLVNASSFGFGLQGGHLWSLPASPDLLSHVRCLSVWVSDGSWPPRPAFVFRSLLSCT